VEWVNITAKSLPEAIDLALDNLGVDEAEAEIEVLEEPRQGLFGRTRGNARVRARVKPKGTRPKVERGRSRKRRDGSEGGGSGGAGSRNGEASGPAGSSRGRSRSGASARGRGGEGRAANEAEGWRDEAEGSSTRSGEGDVRMGAGDRDGDRGRGGRSPGRTRGGGGTTAADGRSSSGERQSREPVEEASVEEVTAQLEAFLSGLTEAFGFEGGVTVGSDGDEGLLGTVNGRHGLMVGPRARTLDAIQELARVSVQRSAPSSVRIKVDVGGYREVRREALRTFALEAAAAVRLDGRERSLEPMSSADRKIVHDTLSSEPGIETRSAGNEPSRRVVVMAAAGRPVAIVDSADDEADDVDAGSVNGAPEVVGGDIAGEPDMVGVDALPVSAESVDTGPDDGGAGSDRSEI
jgi:spoIIIJ-associated protein